MGRKGVKIHRSFPRLVGHLVFIAVVLWLAKYYSATADAGEIGRGPFWPGVLLMGFGASMRIWALGHIRKHSGLATSGPYGFARNPLYLGSFISGLGIALAVQAWWVLGIAPVPMLLLYIPIIRSEDANLTKQYGEEFTEYKKRVFAFLPLPTRYFFKPKERFSLSTALKNRAWANLIYFTATFIAIDLVLLVVWPSIDGRTALGDALCDYIPLFFSRHF